MNNMKAIPNLIWTGARAFFLFWKDFLVGDSPELALGVLIILGSAYALHNSRLAAVVVVIVLVLLLATVTVWRKARPHA